MTVSFNGMWLVTFAIMEFRQRVEVALGNLYRKLSNRRFLLIASVLIALWAGLLAVLLKTVVHIIQVNVLGMADNNRWILLFAPMVGILLTILFVKFVLGGSLEKGTAHVLYAIARKSSKLGRSETYSHIITSALTISLGGSAGLESPIVQTGAAIGSRFSSFFPLGYKDRTLLLACGSAAGIAAAFDAPVAGVLFAMEVLLVEVHVSSFISLLLSGAIGALCSKIILHEEIALTFSTATTFNYYNVPFYALLGIVCGLVSIFYVRTMLRAQKTLRLLPEFPRWLVGGSLLGMLIMIFPAFFSEGYIGIRSLASLRPEQLFHGSLIAPVLLSGPWTITSAVLALALLKSAAVAMTLGSGGNGGNFAPSLFVGACLGFAIGNFLHLAGVGVVSVPNFCLVGMAGMLTGVFHAPLTAIFLIAELTGGYDLMIPLMIVSALSTATSWFLKQRSLDETILRLRLKDFSYDGDTKLLSGLELRQFIETDFTPVKVDDTMRLLVKAIAESRRNVFPVLNDEGVLEGIISLEDIRDKMFDVSLYDKVRLGQLMRPPSMIAEKDEEMISVMAKFDAANIWNIPVVDRGKYVGFVSKAGIFSNYRKRLRRHEMDDSE
jgi:CIC family chloride channel protein